ncbi:MAG: glycine cleavage system protein H [Acidobacteriota bacterium]
MDTLLSVLQSAAVLVGGLAARVGLLLVVLAVLSVPVFLMVSGMKGVEAVRRRLAGVARVGRLFWSDQVYYAPSHAWVRPVNRQRVLVGVDDLAQRLFAAPLGWKLPQPGTQVRAGEPVVEVRTAGRTASIMSPVSGIITRVNDAVREDPSLVHRDPYSRGWLFAVNPSNSAFQALPAGRNGKAWLSGEEQRLTRFYEVQLGAAAADGGDFIEHPPTLLTDDQWQTLTQQFLANRS